MCKRFVAASQCHTTHGATWIKRSFSPIAISHLTAERQQRLGGLPAGVLRRQEWRRDEAAIFLVVVIITGDWFQRQKQINTEREITAERYGVVQLFNNSSDMDSRGWIIIGNIRRRGSGEWGVMITTEKEGKRGEMPPAHSFLMEFTQVTFLPAQ